MEPQQVLKRPSSVVGNLLDAFCDRIVHIRSVRHRGLLAHAVNRYSWTL